VSRPEKEGDPASLEERAYYIWADNQNKVVSLFFHTIKFTLSGRRIYLKYNPPTDLVLPCGKSKKSQPNTPRKCSICKRLAPERQISLVFY
jgi:hypothetical protein